MSETGIIFRDGTSQQGRTPKALDPAYFSVEERSTEDFLRFAQQFARELQYFDRYNAPNGDWTGFLGKPYDPNTDKDGTDWIRVMMSFIDNPDSLQNQPESVQKWLTASHRTLFFAFLNMLKETQTQFKDLTRRHLDYYYRRVLQLSAKVGTPDRVQVIFEPAKSMDAHVVEQGTLLLAGKDSGGKDLYYATEQDLMVTQSRVEEVRIFSLADEPNPNDQSSLALFSLVPFVEGNPVKGIDKYQAFGADLPTHPKACVENLGFAISSDRLNFASGSVRTVTFKFIVSTDDLNIISLENLKNDFDFAFSTAITEDFPYGWYNYKAPESIPLFRIEPKEETKTQLLSLSFFIEANAPTITPHPNYPNISNPIFKATLKEGKDLSIWLQLAIEVIEIEVGAEGITTFAMRTEDGIISKSTDFFLFGNSPAPGAKFSFSHPELCTKPLKTLWLDITWKNIPDDFSNYYAAYKAVFDAENTDVTIPSKSIKADLELTDKTIAQTTQISQDKEFLGSSRINFPVNIPSSTEPVRSEEVDPKKFPRYFSVTLGKKDFLHTSYAKVIKAIAIKPDITSIPVNAPFTPEVESIRLGYTATNSIFSASCQDFKFFHLHNAVLTSVAIPNISWNCFSLLPFMISDKGYLIIGLKNVIPPEQVSLLFQMIPNYTKPEVPKLRWEYWNGFIWKTLSEENGEILFDETEHLLHSGIIRFNVPELAPDIPPESREALYWLRAVASDKMETAGYITGIHAQAVTAKWQDASNAPDHLAKPLPAGSIKSLKVRDPAIRSVEQPYTSFGGRIPEQPAHFDTRVSERLRHKQRALTAWDYERLVLEQFPEVYKVKCLLKDEMVSMPGYDPAAAKVQLVVIPDISNTEPFFPFEPKASNALLEAIREYVQKHTSVFTQVEVLNPQYERIRYRVWIRYHKGYDNRLYRDKTREELNRFLSPWAYEKSADISFGGRIYHASLVYLLEKLPYVDYVANLELVYHYAPTEAPHGCLPPAWYVAVGGPTSILVTDDNHFIESALEGQAQFSGVGFDRVGV